MFSFLFSCQLINKTRNKYKPGPAISETQVAGEEEELEEESVELSKRKEIVLGCERTTFYLDSLLGKRVGIVANQASVLGTTHLVDTLISLGVNVIKVFSPEHGFRGDGDAGEKITSAIDAKTGLPLVSLYGDKKKPSAKQVQDIDIILFDLQDVGVRFYTYISTLHYVMESCAENNKTLLVLDRPNPNAHYIDGPILKPEFQSFIGMHPVPIVYGMTIGEYALMINNEHWLKDGVNCNIQVIPCRNYTHKLRYKLPIPPSPNLRSELAISLYPSLCFFEATTVSVGRGTERPFEMYGHPNFPEQEFQFTPISSFGAKNPLWENKVCQGFDLGSIAKKRTYDLNLSYFIQAKSLLDDSNTFINRPNFFDLLAGTSELRKQIEAGTSLKEIRSSWKDEIQQFRKIRSKYLLYE